MRSSKKDSGSFPEIKSVRTLPDYKIAVVFLRGETRVYDVKPWFDKQPEYFKQLKRNHCFDDVVAHSYAIEWDDKAGFGCDELYYGGKRVKTPFDDLVSLQDALKLWNLKEGVILKAIKKGELLDNIEVRQIGKTMLFSRKALVRLFGPQKTEY